MGTLNASHTWEKAVSSDFPRFLTISQSKCSIRASASLRNFSLYEPAFISQRISWKRKSEWIGEFEVEYLNLLVSFHKKMRLLTHNMLTSHVKGVKNGYPLGIEVIPWYISSHGSFENWAVTKSHSLRSDSILTRGLEVFIFGIFWCQKFSQLLPMSVSKVMYIYCRGTMGYWPTKYHNEKFPNTKLLHWKCSNTVTS